MFQGNWKCSTCGGDITELPFEPRSEKGLTCRSCWSKAKNNEQAAEDLPGSTAAADKQQVPDDVPFDAHAAAESQEDDGLDALGAAPVGKQTFQGHWKCSMCGADITSLPFEPRSTEGLKCLDCFKKSKA